MKELRKVGSPPKEGSTFTPQDIGEMARALDIAVRAMREGSDMPDHVPHEQIRQQLAALIYAEASKGLIKADHLAHLAIRAARLVAPTTWTV